MQYIKIHKALLQLTELTITDCIVFGYIDIFTKGCRYSNKELADELKISASKVSKSISKLAKLNLIQSFLYYGNSRLLMVTNESKTLIKNSVKQKQNTSPNLEDTLVKNDRPLALNDRGLAKNARGMVKNARGLALNDRPLVKNARCEHFMLDQLIDKYYDNNKIRGDNVCDNADTHTQPTQTTSVSINQNSTSEQTVPNTENTLKSKDSNETPKNNLDELDDFGVSDLDENKLTSIFHSFNNSLSDEVCYNEAVKFRAYYLQHSDKLKTDSTSTTKLIYALAKSWFVRDLDKQFAKAITEAQNSKEFASVVQSITKSKEIDSRGIDVQGEVEQIKMLNSEYIMFGEGYSLDEWISLRKSGKGINELMEQR